MLWILVPAGALSGAVAGAVMRAVLGRLARGVLVRPPLCEVAVAVLWAAVALGRAVDLVPAPWIPLLSVLTWLGVAVSVVDLRHHRIPDALTFPALPLVLVCVIPLGGAVLCRGMAGAVLAVTVHAAVHLASPRSMGAGDVKLAAPLGAVLAAAGWSALPLAAVLAALLTATVGIAAVLARAASGRRTPAPDASGVSGVSASSRGVWVRGSPHPHGPSMVVAAVLVTSWFAVAGAAPAPDHRGAGPPVVPADRGEVGVATPGWA